MHTLETKMSEIIFAENENSGRIQNYLLVAEHGAFVVQG
jgi:hypothetical protein